MKAGSSLLLSAAAAAKSLQSCPTLCDSIDGSPPGSPVPGILQARILEWVAIVLGSPQNIVHQGRENAGRGRFPLLWESLFPFSEVLLLVS